MTLKREGHELFVSRLYDAMASCRQTGRPVMTSFLTPAQQELFKTICRDEITLLSGGYEQAERKIGILMDMEDPEIQPDITILKAELNPYQGSLRHPDVLGALMHAGISREMLGDLLCTDTAVYILCKSHMADFIADNIRQIKKQNLLFHPVNESDLPQIESKTIRVNCASLRYDAVIAALAHCSRSKAMDMIRQGLIKVNDVVLDHNGRLCNNDHISIRRTGRFQYLQTVQTTRKDRLVLEFRQYV